MGQATTGFALFAVSHFGGAQVLGEPPRARCQGVYSHGVTDANPKSVTSRFWPSNASSKRLLKWIEVPLKRRILHLNPRKKQLIFLFIFFDMGILRGFQGARACWVCRSTRKGTLSCTARRGFCPGREVQSKSSKAETWEWAPTTGCMSAMSQDYTEYPKMLVRIGSLKEIFADTDVGAGGMSYHVTQNFRRRG